jgi:hypothetical protein
MKEGGELFSDVEKLQGRLSSYKPVQIGVAGSWCSIDRALSHWLTKFCDTTQYSFYTKSLLVHNLQLTNLVNYSNRKTDKK